MPAQLDSWEAYRDVRRLGRKTRLPEAQRATLWSIFEKVQEGLKQRGLITHAGLFSTLASIQQRTTPPYDFAIIDGQGYPGPQLRFLAAGGND
ncbi:hypothetical protein DSL92_07605 [Billgrantia gudaonensis]|uniref:Uncharacterized protein n=1 Tax=Billgrantia gudaonensis TaxID=376427 RepID=A0A432JID5_9GAMM|nr:hypothetical protein DSL92_07605 [Halomonas gudaonensis]